MNKPTRSCMEAYLKQMGIMMLPVNTKELEKEYYRQIYKVQPRESALTPEVTSKAINRRRAPSRVVIRY